MPITPLRKSKHATKPFAGKVTISTHSGLRKRMRAARRGLFAVAAPTTKALLRHQWFINIIKQAELANV